MATTNFIDQETIIEPAWLNEVDAIVHDIFGGASTKAAARTALDVYSATQLDAGQLDNRYYTETELNTTGVLDTRYYTETEMDASLLTARAGRKNVIINGDFLIWQRATSQTSSGFGSSDRWSHIHVGSTKTASQQQFTFGQTDVPDNPVYYCRTVVTSSAGAGNYVAMRHPVEQVVVFSGETVTLSFWAKADAAKDIAIEFYQNFGGGGSTPVTASATKKTLSTTWTKYTETVAIPSISGKTVGTDHSLDVLFWFDAGSDFNTRTNTLGQQSGTFEIAHVQLEKGSEATDFERETYAELVPLCQRYYEKSYNLAVSPGSASTSGSSAYRAASTSVEWMARFSVSKRATPSLTVYSPVTGSSGVIRDSTGGTDVTAQVSNTGEVSTLLQKSTAGTDGNSYSAHWTADAEL